MSEPVLKIGIQYEQEITFMLNGEFVIRKNCQHKTGINRVNLVNGLLKLNGQDCCGNIIDIDPVNYNEASFDLFGVTIGLQFHWERKEDQRFKGTLRFIVENGKITAINELSLEDYLISVISSEMSATSSLELLKAHAIISRSWLIAQMFKASELKVTGTKYQPYTLTEEGYVRWYDREDHLHFDVCADDHCQRYQGITRQTSPLVEKAVIETGGIVLKYNDKICDARFSKSCGGISENFELVWEPAHHHYLQSIADNENDEGIIDLTDEENAQHWIRSSPEAFCNTNDKQVLSQVLNNYDQETSDFYRWKVVYYQSELSALIKRKSKIDFGTIYQLIPVERGKSGRIIRLKIVGSKRTMVIGKELEIRKTLSESHLYSSAFVVDYDQLENDIPGKIILTGAGWGHGVGLCQIGAAMMGEKGYSHKEILAHYFKGAKLEKNY